ncbi:MAG: glycerol-3-phosphate acyltransferase, partial [Ruminococcus sp.]
MEFLTLYWWRILLVAVTSYLLGSLSFAVIISKLSKKQDVREMGSGNAGFTNVLRCVGVVPAILTFVFDFLKGLVSVALAMLIFNIPWGAEGINALSDTV